MKILNVRTDYLRFLCGLSHTDRSQTDYVLEEIVKDTVFCYALT